MTITQPEVRPPFEDLLAELKRRRFNVGVEQRLRLLRLLEKLAGNCEPEQLRTLLCPIFATNETQQTEFYKIFDSLYSIFHVADPNRGKPMEEVRRERKTSRQIRYFLPLVIGFAVTIMILVSQVFLDTINRKSSRDQESKLQGDETLLPSPLGGPPIMTNLPGARLSPSPAVTPTPQPPNPGFSEVLAEYRNEFQWAAVLIPCLGFLTWETVRRRRRNPVLDRTGGLTPPFSWELYVRPPPLPDYNSRQFHAAARKLRRRQSSEIQRFDIALTVSSTIRALGFPRFRFRADTRFPEYLVLIERAAPGDHQAALFDQLVCALGQENLFINRFFFESDPRVCWSDSGPARFSLGELQKRFSGHKLLIFSSAEKLLDPLSGELALWTNSLLTWPERAVLTPTAPSQWGFAERKVAAQFVFLPATLEGVDQLAERFNTGLIGEIGGIITPATEAMPESDGNPEIPKLRHHLGEPLFQWLCACAVYPKLRWELTIYLGSLPAIGENLVTEHNLLKLVQLSWFRTGSIPDPERLHLIESLDAAKEKAAREAIVDLFKHSIAPNLDSYAYRTWNLSFRSQYALLHREQGKRLKNALGQIPPAEIAQDYVLLRLLEKAPASRLSLILPRFLRRLAFENAVPLFGLSTLTRAVVTLAMIGLAWFSIEKFAKTELAPTVQPSLTPSPSLPLGFAVLLISMLLALPVTIILTLAVIRTFRKWVKRSMLETADKHSYKNIAGTLETSKLAERPTSGTALGELKIKQIDVTSEQTRVACAVPLVAAARRRERRLAVICSLAACVHPLILAAVMTVSSYKPSTQHQVTTFLFLYSSFFLVTATPVALAATMILTKQLRFLILSVLALIATFLVLDWVVHGSNLVGLWLMLDGLPTGVILMLNARRVRAVGPIVFAATLVFFCAVVPSQFYGALYMWDVIGPVHFVREDLAQLPLLTAAAKYLDEASRAPAEAIGVLVSHPSSIIRADHPERLTTGYKLLFASISLITIVIGAVTGWAFVLWLAVRYQTRRSSDQMLTIDVLMAIFTVSAFLFFYSAFGLTAAACALAGFGGYKLLMHWLLRPRIGFTPPEGAPTLLLLRGFRSNRNGRPLLEKIMQSWRYLGPIWLIAGTDFAEPHEFFEFFEFLSRRLSRAFVKDREDLEHRLSRHVPGPDPDGLYRIEDFFCHLDTWQMTVAYLAKGAKVVLMDLRGFSSAHQASAFEIEMLLNSVPVKRIVFVVDNSTDRAHLEETLRSAWNTLPSTSPNADPGEHQVSLVRASGHQRTVDSLLGLLSAKTKQSQ